MAKQGREGGAAPKAAKKKVSAKSKAPRRFQGIQKTASGGLKAGVFAKMREPYDVVAFATPGRPTRVRLYEEALEVFQTRKQEPRNLVVIVCQGPETDKFEAFQTSFENFAPLLESRSPSNSERSYWTFTLRGRSLLAPGGAAVNLRKIEKRAVQEE